MRARRLHVLISIAWLGACGRLGFDAMPHDAMSHDAARTSLQPIQITPPRFTTSSPVFEDVPGGSLEIPPSPGQPWLLLVSATLESSSLITTAEARYLVDGVERGIGGTESIEPGRPGPWQHFYLITGGTAATTVTFQARDSAGAMTVIDQLRAVAVPLPPGADPLYAADDGPIVVDWTVFQTAATLTLTPSSPGEYVVLLLANTTEAPSGNDLTSYWLDPAGQPWGVDFQNPRGALQSQLLVRRVTLAGPTGIEFVARAGLVGTVQYVRVLALRPDAFAAYAEALDSTGQTTTSSAITIANELTPALAPSSRYVVFATARVNDTCAGPDLAVRGGYVLVDADSFAVEHRPGNCRYDDTFGFVGLRATPPGRVAVGFSAPNGSETEYIESQLLVLGLE